VSNELMNPGEGPNGAPHGAGSRIFVDVGGDEGGGGKPTRGVGSQAVVALALLLMSVGAIYAMRKVGMISGLSGDALQVKYEPSAINTEFENRFTRAMDDLARSGRPLQVPPDELMMTPFEYQDRLAVKTDVVADPNDRRAQLRAQQLAQQQAEDERKRQAEFARQITQAVNKFEVQGMIGGRVPMATISGKLVRVGDHVGEGDIFEVIEIDGREVIVEASGRRFKLMIGKQPEELSD